MRGDGVHGEPYRKAELRRFGVLLGSSLMVLAVVIYCSRHSLHLPAAIALAGAMLVMSGLAFPLVLSPVRRAWTVLGAGLAWLNTRLLLTIVFYAIATPTSLLLRLAGRDPMNRRWREPGTSSYWASRRAKPFDRDDMRRQF
ncbi:MAG: SxtJ family membrane protein [Phycisphaerae bacterium]